MIQNFLFSVVSPLSLRPLLYLIPANLQYPMCASYEQTYLVSVVISGWCVVCTVQLVDCIIILQCSEYAMCSMYSVYSIQCVVCTVFDVHLVHKSAYPSVSIVQAMLLFFFFFFVIKGKTVFYWKINLHNILTSQHKPS